MVVGSCVATNSGSAVAKAGCSFTPETLVLMADGSTKPISQVEVGDMVMAVDPETGERGPRKVTKLWEHEDNELVLVTVGGKTLKVTPNHPLWVVNRAEWVAAGDLRAGDLLLDDDGSTVRIGSVQRVLQRGVDVHNLTVDDIHTFFVVVGGSSLLVHNTGPLCNLNLLDDATAAKVETAVDILDANGGRLPAQYYRGGGSRHIFENRAVNGQQLLPAKGYGYYREAGIEGLVPNAAGTAGVPGANRIVVGNGGEVYFTSDHYQSFVRLR